METTRELQENNLDYLLTHAKDKGERPSIWQRDRLLYQALVAGSQGRNLATESEVINDGQC